MRRIHTVGAAWLLVLTACAGSEATPVQPATTTTSLVVTTSSTTPPTTAVITPRTRSATLEVWAPAGAVDAVEGAAITYQFETGNVVNLTVVEIDQMLDAILDDPEAGPDIFIGPHTWLDDLTAAGVAEPIEAGSEVAAGAIEAVSRRGVVFGAPVGVDTTVQFRNPDLMSIAPETVESLATGCPAAGGGTGPCLLIPVDSVDGHYPFLAARGGYVFGPDELATWSADDIGVDSDEAVAGVAILETLVEAGVTLGDGESSAEERFSLEIAPLLWGDLSSLQQVRELEGRYIVESLPTIGGEPARTLLRVTAVWVNAHRPDKGAATEFVEEWIGAPSTADRIGLALGLAPATISFATDADLVPFATAARSGHPTPTIFQTGYAWAQLAVTFGQIRIGDDVTGALLDAAVAIRNAPEPEPSGEGEDG
jgi:maltose-binding protein MalE